MTPPKKNVLVFTERPDLRFVLGVMSRVKVITAEGWEQFEQGIAGKLGPIDIALIDARDVSVAADVAAKVLSRRRANIKTIVLVNTPRPDLAFPFDQVISNGHGIIDQILGAIAIVGARKRGPREGSHHHAGIAQSNRA
jgi:hypothetical protein